MSSVKAKDSLRMKQGKKRWGGLQTCSLKARKPDTYPQMSDMKLSSIYKKPCLNFMLDVTNISAVHEGRERTVNMQYEFLTFFSNAF